MKKRYKLGNCLRGGFSGEFKTMEEAWQVLSYRFDIAFPSSGGRSVILKVYETNPYGYLQNIICKVAETSGEKVVSLEHDAVIKCTSYCSDREF